MTYKAEVPWHPFFDQKCPKKYFRGSFLVDAHDVVEDGQIGAKIRSVAQLLRVQ